MSGIPQVGYAGYIVHGRDGYGSVGLIGTGVVNDEGSVVKEVELREPGGEGVACLSGGEAFAAAVGVWVGIIAWSGLGQELGQGAGEGSGVVPGDFLQGDESGEVEG